MSIAEKLVTIAENVTKVYDQGFLEGLSKGKKAQYIEEYFTGSKQYFTYSIDFEPKLIVFLSNDRPNDFEANKPDIENLIGMKQLIDCKIGFTEGQGYLVRGATAYNYKTQKYAVATGGFTNYDFNSTTQKWDVTLGKADTSNALRFVSGGQLPIQVLFVGE